MILKPESLAKAPEPPRPRARAIPAPASSVACNFIVSSFSAVRDRTSLLARVDSTASASDPPSIRGNRLSENASRSRGRTPRKSIGRRTPRSARPPRTIVCVGPAMLARPMPLRIVPSRNSARTTPRMRASTAVDVDAAEHHGRDHEQDRAVGVVAARRAVLADPDEGGDAGKRARQRVGLDLDAGDVDAGGPRRLLVAVRWRNSDARKRCAASARRQRAR